MLPFPLLPPSERGRPRPLWRSLWMPVVLLAYALWLVLTRAPVTATGVPGSAWNLLAVTLALALSGVRAVVPRATAPRWHRALGALHTLTLVAAFALFVWLRAWLALVAAAAFLAVAYVAIARLPKPRD